MSFDRHCWVEIDLDALVHNYRAIKQHVAPAKVCAVVKAAAYGHGDTLVARTLETAGADWFGVSCLSEALHLRGSGIKSDILILGHTDPASAAELAQHKLTQAVFSPEYAAALSRRAAEQGCVIQVHLKVDTGMGRLGFCARTEADIAPCATALAHCYTLSGLAIGGLFQHFAVADSCTEQDVAYTHTQHHCFEAVIAALKALGHTPSLLHCCNSAGLTVHPEWGYDLVRPGIVLYGYDPSPSVSLPGLQPIMSLKATVSQVKQLTAGQGVSYNLQYIASEPVRVATLCVGYADGYPRAMTGQGVCRLRNQAASIVGCVCMDQLLVDVTHIEGVQAGDTATLFGPGGICDTAQTIADKTGTIPYEILCGIGLRVPRVYLQAGKQIAVTNYLKQTTFSLQQQPF